MKLCPRCHKLKLEDENVLNSLSNRDNETYICCDCGDEESYIDKKLQKPSANELAFVSMIEARKGGK